MGRASSTKRKRLIGPAIGPEYSIEVLRSGSLKSGRVPIAVSKQLLSVETLYRHLETESYADDLLAGNVWITTLAACRAAEGQERADPEEGMLTHEVRYVSSEQPGGKAAIEQSGIFKLAEGARNVVISGGGMLIGTMDAFVLCFTEKYAPQTMTEEFGAWCVKAVNPIGIFRAITQQLCTQYPVQRALFGHVRYSGRHLVDYQISETHRALLKPKDGYSHQREVRMVWEVDEIAHPLKPFKLTVPASAKFFTPKHDTR